MHNNNVAGLCYKREKWRFNLYEKALFKSSEGFLFPSFIMNGATSAVTL